MLLCWWVLTSLRLGVFPRTSLYRVTTSMSEKGLLTNFKPTEVQNPGLVSYYRGFPRVAGSFWQAHLSRATCVTSEFHNAQTGRSPNTDQWGCCFKFSCWCYSGCRASMVVSTCTDFSQPTEGTLVSVSGLSWTFDVSQSHSDIIIHQCPLCESSAACCLFYLSVMTTCGFIQQCFTLTSTWT